VQPEPAAVSLAELVATISLGTDLGLGQPMEHVIRQTLLSLRLAERLEISESDRTVVYYAGLLAWVGCHTDAYEQTKWFGDDIELKHESYRYDFGKPKDALSSLRMVGAGQSFPGRLRTWAALPLALRRGAMVDLENHWRAADAFAARLGLSADVRQSLVESYERWDGKGPIGLREDAILLTSRIVQLADVAAFFHADGGAEAAESVVRARSGTQLDPGLVDLFCSDVDGFLEGLELAGNWETVLAAAPHLSPTLDAKAFDTALEAMGDFADLKSPYTIGHSRRVADLAFEAATTLGLADAVMVRRAALVHDLGRLGVPNSIWDKSGPLTASETERVRMHPYLTERMLAFSPGLSPLAEVAIQHHERLDGSGYPRGLSGQAISPAGRVLAAADFYATMVEPRPHREPSTPDEAAARLREQVRAGRFDADAAEAVLGAAGHRTNRRRAWPAGLTAREVEVLRLLARGMTNREIADALVISRRTAGSHIEHIYTKTGATNRATAGLFAMTHGLMSDR
jgi:HD-GYP domain-containing protein (c-di-GMP phosphodiesterase class II)